MVGWNEHEQYELVAQGLARHYEKLLLLARPYATGVIEAEDIVQQAALISLVHSDRLEDDAAVDRWLFRVVRSVGQNIAAKRSRRAKLRGEHVRVNPGFVDPFRLSSELEERVAEVLQAADALSTDQRKVVHCVLNGLSHKETAGELGKTVGAVRVLWHRAVRNLRKLLRRSADRQ